MSKLFKSCLIMIFISSSLLAVDDGGEALKANLQETKIETYISNLERLSKERDFTDPVNLRKFSIAIKQFVELIQDLDVIDQRQLLSRLNKFTPEELKHIVLIKALETLPDELQCKIIHQKLSSISKLLWTLFPHQGQLIYNNDTELTEPLICTPDKKYIIYYKLDRQITVKNTVSDEIFYLSGHTEMITSLIYNPILQQIVSASKDNTIRIWCIESRKCIHTLNCSTYLKISSICCDPEGKYTTSAHSDGMLRIWDNTSGECLQSIRHQTKVSPISTITMSDKYIFGIDQPI